MEAIAVTRTRKRANNDFDLAVIGGGPAGASAAITAARGGARVLLLERGKLPRQRVCGEFVSAESIDLLASLLGPADLLDGALRIPEARLFFDGQVVSTLVEPSAASIARLDLDIMLWRSAEQAHVDARMQTTVDTIAKTDDFHLSTSAGTFQARAVINATGRWSNLRAQSAADSAAKEIGQKWLGVKAHFSEPDPHISVDLYFFDGGYCGVQPVTLAGHATEEGGAAGVPACRSKRVNACAMVRSDIARSLPEVFALNPELKRRAKAWRQLGEAVTTSPLIFRDPAPVAGGILMTGDAAGFVDPFVGDGISLALRSGALAAQSLIPFFKRQSSLEQVSSQYGKDYNDRLLPVFRNSSKIRRLLSLPRPVRRSVGHILEATPAFSRLFVRLTR
ncbi:MAG TPA: FAD-dependent oxidoreductase [Terriglobales bacterium]|nr:FAD-dependent oxidoreductase [Terriglobales bacterium]